MYNNNKKMITSETEPFFKKLGLSYRSVFLFDCNVKFELEDEIDDTMHLTRCIIIPSIGRVNMPIEAQEVLIRQPIDSDVFFSYDKKGLSLSKERCLYFFKYHLDEKMNSINNKRTLLDVFFSFFSLEKRRIIKEKNEKITNIQDTLDILNPDMIRVCDLPSYMTTYPILEELNNYIYYDLKEKQTYDMYIEVSNIIFQNDFSNYGQVTYKFVNKKDDSIEYLSLDDDNYDSYINNGYIKLSQGIVFVEKTAFEKFILDNQG